MDQAEMIGHKSLVLGGTGMVGRHILRRLVLAGERPFALSRVRRVSTDVNWLQGDLTNPQTLALPSIDRVFCTVDISLLAPSLEHIYTPSLKSIVAFSSSSVLTKANSEIPQERESIARLLEAEHKLIKECESRNVGWTILRPTLIYDEGYDVNVTRLAQIIKRFRFLPLSGRGSGLRQPVHADDLAIGALAAIATPAAANKIYILAGIDTISYREMVGRIFDGLNLRRNVVSVPPWLWRSMFLSLRCFFPRANTAIGTRMMQDMVFDTTAARVELGWAPRPFLPRFDR